MSDQLSLGQFPLSYLGVGTIPTQPTPLFVSKFVPTSKNTNFQLGTHWLVANKNIPQNKNLYALVSLTGNSTSTLVAVWVLIATGTGSVIGLHADDGNNAFPLNGLINIHNTDGFINITAATPNTATFNLSGGVVIELTGDNNIVHVPPLAGNINIVGTANKVTVTGNAATNTLTINTGANVATTYTGDGATVATPAAGNLNVISNAAANNSGSSVTITGAGSTLTLNVTDANHNTTIGNLAGNLGFTTGANNTALGYQAGSAVGVTNSSNILIGNVGAAENNKIRIGTNGTGAGQQNQTFLLGGNVTKPNSCCFLALLSANATNQTGNGAVATVIFDTVIFDNNANYNNGTGVFTAPVTGKYHFSVVVVLINIVAANTCFVQLTTTARGYQSGEASPVAIKTAGGEACYALNAYCDMTAGDTATVVIQATGEAGNTNTIEGAAFPKTYFSGSLVA